MNNESSKNYANYFGESAFIIAAITASLYFVGYGYYRGFFNELSLPLGFSNIQTTEYITASFKAIAGLSLLIILFFIVWSKEPKNRLEAFFCNLPMIICVIILGFDSEFKNIGTRYLLQGLVGVLIVMIIFISYKSISIVNTFYKTEFKMKIIMLLSIIALLYIVSYDFGTLDARKLIEGKDTLRIQISLKDKTSTQIQNKELIPVMLYDNKYYVLEKNNTSQEYNRLHIIQSDEIEIATLYRAKN